MRQDTKVLLDRLGEETFQYYDFESPSAETDVWPIFEALLLDERVVGRVAHRSLVEPSRAETQAKPAPARVAPDVQPGMFGNYDAAAAADEPGESVRDMLGRLATSGR